ncbi:hypothetical protein ILFOPFJJ_05816 [Ensifer psoraleae]|nr:hypothetical protein [Sinorhizobium psoraleae]
MRWKPAKKERYPRVHLARAAGVALIYGPLTRTSVPLENSDSNGCRGICRIALFHRRNGLPVDRLPRCKISRTSRLSELNCSAYSRQPAACFSTAEIRSSWSLSCRIVASRPSSGCRAGSRGSAPMSRQAMIPPANPNRITKSVQVPLELPGWSFHDGFLFIRFVGQFPAPRMRFWMGLLLRFAVAGAYRLRPDRAAQMPTTVRSIFR